MLYDLLNLCSRITEVRAKRLVIAGSSRVCLVYFIKNEITSLFGKWFELIFVHFGQSQFWFVARIKLESNV